MSDLYEKKDIFLTKNNFRKYFINKHAWILICVFLALTTYAVYSQVHTYSFVLYDDYSYVKKNPHIVNGFNPDSISWAFTSGHASNWHPITWLSHMLDVQFFGINPGKYHLTSLFFHIANTILLFLVFRKMTGNLLKSGFVAALFALHPMHVESVVWIAERKDVLSTFFWMLTMFSYVMYTRRPGIKRYIPVVIFYIMGLMSKPMLVTLPFVLLLMDFWPLERIGYTVASNNTTGKSYDLKESASLIVCEKIPLLVFAAISCFVTIRVQSGGKAVGSLDVFPITDRLFNALISYVGYIGKMIWPVNLCVIYPYPAVVSGLLAVVACLLLLLISISAIRTAKLYPWFITGWLWYLGTLFPVIGLVQIGSQSMADRYTYVPFIGLFVIMAWGVPEIMAKYRWQKLTRVFLFTVLIPAMMAVSWFQVRHWKDSIALFERAINVTTDNYVAHSNLGIAYAEIGSIEKAICHYNKTLELYPDFISTHNNLGIALSSTGRYDEAIEHYFKALQIDPGYATAHRNLCNAMAALDNFEHLLSRYLMTFQNYPGQEIALYKLGIALSEHGRMSEAINFYFQALAVNPDMPYVHNNIGTILASQGKLYEAVKHYSEAIQIYPDFARAHKNMGVALIRIGKIDEAISHFKKALVIIPDDADADRNLKMALTFQGKINTAAVEFQKTLAINPRDPLLHKKLKYGIIKKKELNQAIHYLQKALSRQPGFNRDALDMDNLTIVKTVKKEYDNSLFLFRKISEQTPDNADAYYNIACIHARHNRIKESVTALEKAVNKGFEHINFLKTDTDLDNIRNTSFYKQLGIDHTDD